MDHLSTAISKLSVQTGNSDSENEVYFEIPTVGVFLDNS